MKQIYPIVVILSLAAGLVTQFIWKMIYFPEPVIPVIIELTFIIGLTISSVWVIATKWEVSVMRKPCDNCTVNVEQAIDNEEITCYLTCEKWLQWSKEKR